jgi:multiple sugar transport system substrate-binding protein
MASQITRREVIKRGVVGAAGLTFLPAVIAACNNSATPSPTRTPTPSPVPTPASPSPTATPTPQSVIADLAGGLTIGSYHSDESELAGMRAANAAFFAATGLNPVLNTIDNGTFANVMDYTTYLESTPDEVFTWFSGYRMRFFADRGLLTVIDDVWAKVSSNFTAGFAKTVTGSDGHVYGIPVDYYPWAMFYRKSVWGQKGYAIPATWDDLLALCARMKKDGLTPIAFSDKDGWPAMGTFDILDLRLNGYDFHMGLVTGLYKWSDPRVTAVFEAWRVLVPFYTRNFAGLTWQEAADALTHKQAGMFYVGLFVTGEVSAVDKTAVDDIDFFPFPYFGNGFDAEQAIDAPVDTLVVTSKSPTLAPDLHWAKAYLEFWAKGSTQLLMYEANNGFIPTASDTDLTKLDRLTARAMALVSGAQRITQFLDRDTRPEFAGANAMQTFLLSFLKNPMQDLAALEDSIQRFWDSLPDYQG